jgi:ATP-dependent DNA helicase RecG
MTQMLVLLELLEKKGKGNRTYYVPGRLFRMPESTKAGSESTKVDGQSTKVGSESTKVAEHADSSRLATSQLPTDLALEVVNLGKRPGRRLLRLVIQALCTWKPLTSDQLASVLERARAALVRDHLKPMIDAGHLKYGIPELPQHPDQTYIPGNPLSPDDKQ